MVRDHVARPRPPRRHLLDWELLDWPVADGRDPGWRLVATGAGGDAIGENIGATPGPDGAGRLTVYVKMNDLLAALGKSERRGCHSILAPTDRAGDFSRFATCSDPDGHTVGHWS